MTHVEPLFWLAVSIGAAAWFALHVLTWARHEREMCRIRFSCPKPRLQYVGGRPARMLINGIPVDLRDGDEISAEAGQVLVNGTPPPVRRPE